MKQLHDRDLKVTLNTHPADGIRAFEDSYERMCKALGKDPKDKEVNPNPGLTNQSRLTYSQSHLTRPTGNSSTRISKQSIILLKMKALISGGWTGNKVRLVKPPELIRYGY
jgi:hypothetical protein